MYTAATEWYTSNLMSSSRLQTTFTGFPVFFESTAASTAKSGNDFRPNPPPSSVTCTVTSSFFNPSACAIASRPLRALRRRPHFGFAVAVRCHRGWWLHRCLRQQRRIAFRFDDFSALREGLIHIAVLAHNLPRLPRRFL